VLSAKFHGPLPKRLSDIELDLFLKAVSSVDRSAWKLKALIEYYQKATTIASRAKGIPIGLYYFRTDTDIILRDEF